MAEVFHWFIFAWHLFAALFITFGVWFRCDPGLWVTRLYVDTYALQNDSYALWLDDADPSLLQRCSLYNVSRSRHCFEADLPLYERVLPNVGWQLFALLGNFEWISAAFAFFYVRGSWEKDSWKISSGMVFLGTLFFMPFRGPVFVNQVVLQLANMCICVFIFYKYQSVHKRQPALPGAPSSILAPASGFYTAGEGNLVPSVALHADLPALRFCEYCVTASELWVAVFSVYVQDAPAFMTIGGYTLIFLTNLYGVLLHYSLVSDHAESKLDACPSLPAQLTMRTRKGLRVPSAMLRAPLSGAADARDTIESASRRKVWGSYIASSSSTLFNSWLAYLVAMGLIFYQQTFLFSSEPPAFVVFAGWSLIVSFSSFGLWMTLVYWYPQWVSKLCCCLRTKETYDIALYGLDVLSLSSKLSIVGSLSYGFIFRAEGRCN